MELEGTSGNYRANKGKEGSSQTVRARRVAECGGIGRLYLLSLARPGCCNGLGGACLFETKFYQVMCNKCMEWNELTRPAGYQTDA